jgi:hypothetical protein
LEQEGTAFEVHAVAGEAGGDVEDGVAEVGEGVERAHLVGLVLVDWRDDVVAVVVAHVVVVHGGGAAAVAGLIVLVQALVRNAGFAAEVFVTVWHGGPLGIYPRWLKWMELRVGIYGLCGALNGEGPAGAPGLI